MKKEIGYAMMLIGLIGVTLFTSLLMWKLMDNGKPVWKKIISSEGISLGIILIGFLIMIFG